MIRFFLLLFCLLQSAFASVEIEGVNPRGFVPGTNTIVTFSGTGVGEMTNFWSTFGGSARVLTNSDPNQLVLEVSCPSNACGIGAIQLAGPKGASAYELVLADSLPATRSKEARTTIMAAMGLNAPCAVDGVAKREATDYYKVHGTAGEIFSIEIYAHRLGSEMDPVVQVLDVDQQELAFCDDEGGTSRDSRFQFKCHRDGDFYIAVHDVGFGGGKGFEYRLRVGNFPLLWFTYPLVPQADEQVEYYGMGIRSSRLGLCAENKPSFPVPNVLEHEPNNNAGQATKFSVPAGLNGKFQYSGDVDIFRFEAKKNEKISFRGKTRSLNSPCDLVLRIKNGEGKVVKESDLASANEGSVTNAFGEAGEYFLEVHELSGTAGANMPYLILAEKADAGFEVTSENETLELHPGGEAKLKLNCDRYQYDGPIKLEIQGSTSGVELLTAEIPKKKNEAEIKVRVAENTAPGTLVHFQIRATSASPELAAMVSTGPALKKRFPLLLYAENFLDGKFALVVTQK